MAWNEDDPATQQSVTPLDRDLAFRLLYCIPVQRGMSDAVAGRRMLRTLRAGEVLGILPQGGIDERRMESGYPGVGYLTLKTGVPVIPASVRWRKGRPSTLWRSLLMPGHATVRYGTPIHFGTNPHPDHEAIRVATDAFMTAIHQVHGAVGSDSRLRA